MGPRLPHRMWVALYIFATRGTSARYVVDIFFFVNFFVVFSCPCTTKYGGALKYGLQITMQSPLITIGAITFYRRNIYLVSARQNLNRTIEFFTRGPLGTSSMG
uniref:Uncharacterized protein n=1 Tax=Glypta fumiferanae TaxID=389681 RepID=A0A0G2JCD7_9HYME|nr:hypothetical protein [Glypta fumiferanae]